MKNYQYIRKLSIKDLAKLLIREEERLEYEDDDLWSWSYTWYIAPDGEEFLEDYNEALRHTIDWLNADRKDSR